MSRTSSLSLSHSLSLQGAEEGALRDERLFSGGKCFCTCGVILKLHFPHRGARKRWRGSTHEKTTWSSVVFRAAPLAEPPARLNSGRGRTVGKPPLTGPRKQSLSSAHTLSTPEAQSTVRPLISHYHNGLGTVTLVQILL